MRGESGAVRIFSNVWKWKAVESRSGWDGKGRDPGLDTLVYFLPENVAMLPDSKYARIEWERRFLLEHFPRQATVTRIHRINDRYIEGTTLRLRQQSDSEGRTVFKFTQKLGGGTERANQGLLTTMYLTKDEFGVLANLPAKTLSKTRHSVPPFGIDVFEGVLSGLVLAEAEFDSAAEASALVLPPFILDEVSDDPRFTGGSLVTASREELVNWLQQHGINLNAF